MKKRNYLGTFVYYYNILNYVISDMLSQWDLAIDAMGGKQSFNRYNWCSFCTYSLVVYGFS